jgi:outer membrane protein assembly factor BamB
MMQRFAGVLAVTFVTASLGYSQQNNVYSKAVPPEKAALDRLNLKTEWTAFLPVEGTRDSIAQVQTIDDQVFVQTRTGLLVAIDANTGRTQWAAKLGNGSYGNSYPVAANAKYVFVAHITKLYAFYRYTGVTEFVAELGTPPTVGLAADTEAVYCVLGMRPGNAGAHRVAVYNLPRPITVNEPIKGPADPLLQGAKPTATNPVDDLLKRYPTGTITTAPDVFDPVVRPSVMQTPVSGLTGTKTPSVSTLPSVVPPYSLDNRAPAPSFGTLQSFRQPYHLRLESGKYVQSTPSLSTIPPSIAASLLLTDLRPKAVEPPLRWEYGLTSRILYTSALTPTRVWAITDDNIVLALNKRSEAGKVVTEVSERLTSPIAAAPAATGVTHYLPLDNGTLLAVDASSGNLDGGLNLKWRSSPGGINNRTPFVTKDYLYAAGDDSGVVCLNRANGDVIWRSENNADRVIGANEEFVYVRDRQGRFLVFDAKRPTDKDRKKSAPLGSANFADFNVHIVNTASDRVYLAADNGLIVCLRDAGPKYAKPVRIWPAADVNPAKQVGVDTLPGKDGKPNSDTTPKTP